jgi:hypothetical protein
MFSWNLITLDQYIRRCIPLAMFYARRLTSISWVVVIQLLIAPPIRVAGRLRAGDEKVSFSSPFSCNFSQLAGCLLSILSSHAASRMSVVHSCLPETLLQLIQSSCLTYLLGTSLSCSCCVSCSYTSDTQFPSILFSE